MIESICSKEEDELQVERINATARMPKNVRQIGQIEGSKMIYIEDYVMTYIRQLALKNVGKYQVAVLLGKYTSAEDKKNILISAAVEVKEVSFEENIQFSNEAWTSIYEDIKKYFSNIEIVGWFLTKAGLPLEMEDRIKKLHLDNFAGQDKTLLMYESIEREEAFYLFDGNYLKQQTGYYIYYEKNEEMQSYMIQQKGEKSEEARYEDRAVKEIRTIIAAKKEMPQEKKLVHLFYGASTALAAVILVIGATMLNNYDKMKNMEQTLHVISANLNEKDQGDNSKDSNTDTTQVNTMPGNVTTIKEEAVISEVTPTIKPTQKVEEREVAVEEIRVYVVKEGDTLASISKKVYQSNKYIEKIQKENDIKDQDKIYIGQKLIMP